MLRIGINGRSLFRQMTGVQHYAREVTRALCALEPEGVDFTVFAGREGRREPEAGLPLATSTVPAGGPLRGMLWEQALLRRMVKKAGVDILFNPGNVAPLSPPVPSVVTVHDLAFLLYPQYFSRAFATYYRQVIPRVVAKARAVITVSESTRNDLVRLLDADTEKIVVIPNGVSPAFRKRVLKKDLAAIREKHRLPEKFFLSVSSLEPRKNLQSLLKAYRLLPEEVTSEHRLVLAGAGNRIFADADLEAELTRIPGGTVHILGYVPSEDLPALYRLSTALVYPSLYEGFGLPVLEAMAASTPVISSNRSSLPEVAGHAAALVDPESVEELAAAMELITTDSGTRNLLIERGKKRAAQFSWEKTAKMTLEVLKSAAG